MAIANPRIHIICGICGCKDMMTFRIVKNGNCDKDGNEYDAVYISCRNCLSLTNLNEIIEESR